MRFQNVDINLVVPSADAPAHAPAPAPVPTQGVPAQVGQPSPVPFDLPRTGIELLALLVIAVALLALGAVLVKYGTSRRSTATS